MKKIAFLLIVCLLSTLLLPGAAAADAVFTIEPDGYASSAGGRLSMRLSPGSGVTDLYISCGGSRLISFEDADLHFDGELSAESFEKSADFTIRAKNHAPIEAQDLGCIRFSVAAGVPDGRYPVKISVWGRDANEKTVFQTSEETVWIQLTHNAALLTGSTALSGEDTSLTLTLTENSAITRLVIRPLELEGVLRQSGAWSAVSGAHLKIAERDGVCTVTAGGAPLPDGTQLRCTLSLEKGAASGSYTCLPQITAYAADGSQQPLALTGARITVSENPDDDGGRVFAAGKQFSAVLFEPYDCPNHDGCLAERFLYRCRIQKNESGRFVSGSFWIASEGEADSANAEQMQEFAALCSCIPYERDPALLAFSDGGKYSYYSLHTGEQTDFSVSALWDGAVDFFYGGILYEPLRLGDGSYCLYNRQTGSMSSETYRARGDTESPDADATMVIVSEEKLLLRISDDLWYVFSCRDGSVSGTMRYAQAYRLASGEALSEDGDSSEEGNCPHTETRTQSTEPTCTEGGLISTVCTACGSVLFYQQLLPSGHSFSDWTVSAAARDEQYGVESRVCVLCGEKEIRYFDENGDYVDAAGNYVAELDGLSTSGLRSLIGRIQNGGENPADCTLLLTVPVSENGSTSFSVPRELFRALAEAGLRRVTFSSDLVSLSFDRTSLQSVLDSTYGNPRILAERVGSSEAQPVARLLEKGSAAYDLVIGDASTTIAPGFLAGSVRVSLPMQLPDGAQPSAAIIRYSTEAQRLPHCVYSESSRSIRFRVTGSDLFCTDVTRASYDDIAGHWGEADMLSASARGLFIGTGVREFSPELTMTRGMFITVLGRLDGVDASRFSTDCADVPADAYYAGYIGWAQEESLWSGSAFRPEERITREESAVFFARYLRLKRFDADTSLTEPFADLDGLSADAQEDIAMIRSLGIILGKGENRFCPADSSTRAEICAMFNRVIRLIVNN